VPEAAHEKPGKQISSLLEARYGRRLAEIQQDVHVVNFSQKMVDLFSDGDRQLC
jgi:GntR family transcriptional regulator